MSKSSIVIATLLSLSSLAAYAAPPAPNAASNGVPPPPPAPHAQAPTPRPHAPAPHAPAPHAPAPHAPAPHAPAPHAPAPHGATQMDMQSVAQGQVQRVLINPYGEIDGLRLDDGTIVKFPPHMSEAFMRIASPGETVRIMGQTESYNNVKAHAIINVNTTQSVVEQPPMAHQQARPLPPHLRAQALQPQQVAGNVDTVLTGRHGEINGVILTDGSIVRFPPGSLRQSLEPGAPFAASGIGTRNQHGTALEAIRVGPSVEALQELYGAAR